METPSKSPNPTRTPSPSRVRKWLSRLGWLGIIASLTGVAAGLFIVPTIDQGGANVTMGLSSLLLVLAIVWRWVFHPSGHLAKRLALTLLGFAGVAGGIKLALDRYAFTGFDGEIIPQFRLRNQPVATNSPTPSSTQPDTVIQHPFTQFLGPDRSGVISTLHIDSDWNAHPPTLEWTVPCGEGWAGITVVENRLFTLEQVAEEEQVTCRRIQDGQPLWKHTISTRHQNILGGNGPRSTPTYHEGRLYTLGATGHLACLDPNSGSPFWTLNLLEHLGIDQAKFEAAVSWGYAGSPLIHQGRLLVPLGGPSENPFSLIALDASTGQVLWKNGKQQISYASPMIANLCGQELIILVNEASVTGHDTDTGDVLWEIPWNGQSNGSATCTQPLVFKEDTLFLSKGYGIGSACVQFQRQDNTWKWDFQWQNAKLMRTKFANPVSDGTYIFGLSDGILQCIRLQDGKEMWKKGRYGHGQLLLVGKHLLLTSETGSLVLLDATPEGHRELGSLPILEGVTWNIPSVADDLCFMRNGSAIACIRLPLSSRP